LVTAISTALIATVGCSSSGDYKLLSMKSDSNEVNTTAARPAMISVKVDEEKTIILSQNKRLKLLPQQNLSKKRWSSILNLTHLD